MPNAGSNISSQIQEIARNIKIELRARAHPMKLSLKRRRTSEVLPGLQNPETCVLMFPAVSTLEKEVRNM